MDIQCGGHHHELAEKATRFDISTTPMVRLYHHLFCPTDLSSIISINQLVYWIQIIQKIHHVHHVHHLHHVEKDGKSPKSPCSPPFHLSFDSTRLWDMKTGSCERLWQLWGSTKHEMNLQRGPRNDS